MHHFDELLTLVRVVEAESLTAAAERLYVAKSVVSCGLASLEQRHKVKLVTRTTRRVVATELG